MNLMRPDTAVSGMAERAWDLLHVLAFRRKNCGGILEPFWGDDSEEGEALA